MIDKIKKKLFKFLRPHVCEADLQKIAELSAQIDISASREIDLREEVIFLEDELKHQKNILKELKEEQADKYNEVDVYCKKRYPEIPNRAYTNKRDFLDVTYTEFINTYIQPNSYPIMKFKDQFSHYWSDSPTFFDTVRRVCDYYNRLIVYTSDMDLHNSVDYYQTPAETIAIKKGDCEDFAFILASVFPEQLGVAYGFYRNGIGHAFNVFMWNDELWIVDASNHRSEMYRVDGKNHDYIIHFIITPKHTYLVRMGVEFGNLAGWSPL